MSWDTLDAKTEQTHEQKLAQEQQIAMAKAYKRLFSSEDGAKVLADLNQRFIYNNTTNLDAVNPNYEAAFHNGESGVVKFCHLQMGLAEQK
jgi:hypothetical protein